MITKNNVKELMQTIDTADIEAAICGDGDYILMEAHIFNVGAYASIECMDYREEVDEAAAASGNLFTDKDEFLRLAAELEVFY